jgi:MFS transporter, DHA2 family, multidrug resistance protein
MLRMAQLMTLRYHDGKRKESTMSVTAPIPEPEADGLPAPRRHIAIAVLLLTLVLVVLDGAIANIALPSIAASLHAAPADVVWVVSAYQLAVLVALLPFAVIGEIYGARRVFLAGVAIFIVGSAGCTFSPNLPALVAARFLQGIGGGAVMALGIMNLRYSVPQRQIGTIIGINAMTIAVAAAAGPGLAGAVLAVGSWPWLFAINIPLGLVILAAGRALAPTKRAARRLNVRALIANTLMFLLFFLGADRITQAPVQSALLIGASIACLIGLLRIERNDAAPLVPRDLLAIPVFRSSVVASVCCFIGQTLGLIALPFYLQHGSGLTATEAGFYMMPWPAAVAVIAPISGWLANRVRTAWLCTLGASLLAMGLACIAFTPSDPHGRIFLISAVVAGMGFGLFQTPNNRILLLSVPKSRSGGAGAMQGTARLTGQTLGAIAMAVTFGATSPEVAPPTALMIAAGFAALAAVVSATRARKEILA